MNDFGLWFTTGTEHILDWKAYDHILYVMVLCVMFSIKQWKELLILVTAFTVGHSFTLAFSAFDIITVKQIYIEVLIPLTIIMTCLINIFAQIKQGSNSQPTPVKYNLTYGLALLFGFIHGMGFSFLLKAMLGKENEIIFPLFAFNLGLELGQLIIVSVTFSISAFLFRFTRLKRSHYTYFISSAVFLVAFLLFIERLKEL